jgi:multimeric flavodoxin WrbA
MAALRDADGIIVASPAYHGTVSGVVKNALDYAQDLVSDAQPYFDGRAVGLIAVAGGWQAAGSTLATLRSITHALRGWPTPMAVTANSSQALFDPDGLLVDPGIEQQLEYHGAASRDVRKDEGRICRGHRARAGRDPVVAGKLTPLYYRQSRGWGPRRSGSLNDGVAALMPSAREG